MVIIKSKNVSIKIEWLLDYGKRMYDEKTDAWKEKYLYDEYA